MKLIETYRGVVYPGQLDHMGHMNVQWYVAKFDEATWHLTAAVGITTQYMREHNRGMAAVEQITRYRLEVMSGDLLVVKSRVIETSDKTIRFRHEMYNAESMQEVANTQIVGVHIDRKIRKSCPLPQSVIEKCAELFDL